VDQGLAVRLLESGGGDQAILDLQGRSPSEPPGRMVGGGLGKAPA
jgi:hypothetical protein